MKQLITVKREYLNKLEFVGTIDSVIHTFQHWKTKGWTSITDELNGDLFLIQERMETDQEYKNRLIKEQQKQDAEKLRTM